MTEAQVSEAYNARFSRFAQREHRLQLITEAAPPGSDALSEHYRAWVIVTLLPAYPGTMDISAKRLRAIEKWANDACRGLERGTHWNARALPSIERVTVTTETQPVFGYFLQLYTDGAASAAAQLLTDDFWEVPSSRSGRLLGVGLYGHDLVRKAAECLRVAAAHALRNAGARGQALARCSVFSPQTPSLGYEHHNTWTRYEPSRALLGPAHFLGIPRGIEIDAVLADPVEWLSATRLILTDLFHAFGQPEVLHITENGFINTYFWPEHTVERWAAVKDVPQVAEEIPFR
jgi:hypothetical protein